MHPKQVKAEIAIVIAPDRVDVIGVVLGVVILDEERRTLDAIVFGLTARDRSSPSEMYLIQTGAANLFEARCGHVRGHVTRVLLDERNQKVRLLLVHLGGRQPDRRAYVSAPGIRAEDVF